MQLIKFRWGHTGLGLALNPMTDILIRKEKAMQRYQHTQREDALVKTEAEIGVMQLSINQRIPRIVG